MENFNHIFESVKKASKIIANLSEAQRNDVLLALASEIDRNHEYLIEANEFDLHKLDPQNPLYDRLKLTSQRLDDIAASLRAISKLKSPLGEIMEQRTLPNGIELKKVRVPFGVIGIVYEARPNVTFDVFALCFKTGNAAVLKGGHDAENSNKAIISIIHKTLKDFGIPVNCCVLLPSTHESTTALLNAVGKIDLCIPRGGKNLINYVRENAKVPVIETGAGVVHTYFDKAGDLEIGKKVIQNGKTRRVSVCNALDSLLIHSERLQDLPDLVKPLENKKVELFADERAFEKLMGNYPDFLLKKARKEDCDREWMDHKMGIYTVNSLQDAILHIDRHGSGHSESIITEDEKSAEVFCREVDAACVYVNLPTSFSDGGEFGLGAEIGISTQKLGPRGPMGLAEITTYRYVLSGHGQIRQ
ncbi:MAG: glutamate-5-semialdehyde dehydrogenase [Muribaculaceae bacterium]|nr:glutamate-5-semialdehyde dehydrogenase [Muribaculaceae bacterium]